MGWLKNFTIINVTRRSVNDLLTKMNMITETYPDPNEVDLKEVLEKIIVLRGGFPKDLSWDEAFVLYIIQVVTNELSYDPTMGQGEDILLINNTAYKTLQRMNYVSPDRCVEVYEHFIRAFREQRERLKDPDGFTLKEREEWEQLLKEERD